MKYFSPSYWFKMWLLSAPLFNSKNEGIYAKSIDNQNIKDWASNNTNLELIENKTLNLSNNQTIQFQNNENISSSKNLENDDFYENFFKTQGWSNNPEIAQQQLIEIQEEHHNFLKQEHENKKRHKNLIKREETTRIFYYTIIFEMIEDNPIAFFNELTLLTRNLVDNNILVTVDNNENNNLPYTLPYTINQNSQYNYFSINVNINNQNDNRILRLFFRSSDLYLQGYIADNSNRYRYFSDSTLTNPNIENVESSQLSFSGSYTSLRQNENYSWQTIYNDFYTLAHSSSTDNQIIQSSTGVILSTSESLRFYEVGQAIIRSQGYLFLNPYTTFNIQNIETTPESWTNFFQPIVTNWQTWTNHAINYLQQGGTLNDWYIDLFNTNNRQNAIRIFMAAMFMQIKPCTHKSKRDIDNNKVCYETKANPCQYKTYFVNKNQELYSINCNSSEIKKVNINGKINVIRILDKNTKGGNLEAGTIYVGTENGVYYISISNNVFKFNGLEFEIKEIFLDGKGSSYVINDKNEIYHLDLHGLNSKKIKSENITKDEFKSLILKIKRYEKKWNKDLGIVTFIHKLNTNTNHNHFQSGDMYINTDKFNVYYFFSKNDNLIEIKQLSDNINSLKFFDNYLYLATENKEIYVLDASSIIDYGLLFAQKIYNYESSDLNKEFIIKYNQFESDFKGNYNTEDNIKYSKSKDFKLNSINPISNYKKIEFLGDTDSNCWGTMVNWGSWVYTNDCDAHWGSVHKFKGMSIKKRTSPLTYVKKFFLNFLWH